MEGKPLNTGSSALATEVEETINIESRTTTNVFLRNLLWVPIGFFRCERMHLLSPSLLIFRGNLAGLLGEVALRN